MRVQVYELVQQHAALGPGHQMQPCSSNAANEASALTAAQPKPAHLLTGKPHYLNCNFTSRMVSQSHSEVGQDQHIVNWHDSGIVWGVLVECLAETLLLWSMHVANGYLGGMRWVGHAFHIMKAKLTMRAAFVGTCRRLHSQASPAVEGQRGDCHRLLWRQQR